VLGHSVRSAQGAVSALRSIRFPGPPPGRTVGPDPAWVDLARHPGAEQVPGVEVVRVGRNAPSMIHRYGPEEAGGSMSAGQQ